MRGKKTVNKEGVAQFDLNDAFTVFDGIKNTPKYWQSVKYDMIARLENIGPFHLFFTLSCGDTRYDENFSSFLVENGYEMSYSVKDDGTTETIVASKHERQINKNLETFLKEDIDESLHEMIRTNVLTATRNFQHRVDAFRTQILMGKNNPINVKFISYRIEFQGRGAAHIHGTLWLDLKKIEKSAPFLKKMAEQGIENGMSILSEAFCKFRDNSKLNETEKYAIAIFTDMFITCSLNPNTVGKAFDMEKFGNRIVKIAMTVNCHHHTKSCKKYQDKCCYGFPRFPLKKTLVIDKNEYNEEDNSNADSKSDSCNYNKILSDIEEVLVDEDVIKILMERYPKGETIDDYDSNRCKRIDDLLEIAGRISYDDYITALKMTRKHGSTVLLQRDIDEIFVNNYNPEWLVAWDANLDIQPVMDYFAVITYVTDYWAKADQGITPYLKEAAENLKDEPDQQKRCQQLANTFLTHRQMGEAEAYYKIFPHLTLKYSNIDTIFIPSDKKELRSKFLVKLDETDPNFIKGVEVKGGKEGIFMEKPDVIDKYCRRDIEDRPVISELCPTQFGKMYDPIRRRKTEDILKETSIENTINNVGNDDNQMEGNDENEHDDDEDFNFIISPDYPHLKRIPLPQTIKIRDPQPGEVAIWKKRTFPKAMRIHKKREDNNAHRYYLSELMLYTAYTNEKDLGCDDENKCMELYLENQIIFNMSNNT